jgi:GTP-binding protein
VREEVRQWEPALLERPQLVVATKRDAVTGADPLSALEAEARALGLEVRPVSAVSGEGLGELKRSLGRLVREAGAARSLESLP